MSKIITVEAEIDLDEYEDYIREKFCYFTTKELLLEYIEELHKDLYVYSRPVERTVESIYEDLNNLIKEMN